ncbi:hypothetical protein BN1221_04769 [Brenneria goodwinii]|uniref:Uncharacterized protein n=1 Tax=Brenneria goodwinii TaxID=1109412 RepID=A0A0G4K250_9GAMM|nr:hypothetical protein BN1221_04769 [Brenneria goodwinii]
MLLFCCDWFHKMNVNALTAEHLYPIDFEMREANPPAP